MTRKKLRPRLARRIRLLTGLPFVQSLTIARHAVKTNGMEMPKGVEVDGMLCMIDGLDWNNEPILTTPVALGPHGECHLASTIKLIREGR